MVHKLVHKLLSSRIGYSHYGGFRAFLLVGLLGITTLALSQTERGWTGDVGAGVTPLVGDISNRLDNGWNFRIGGGYNFTDHLSTTLQFTYNGLGVGQRVLNEARVPDGHAPLSPSPPLPRLSLTPPHPL